MENREEKDIRNLINRNPEVSQEVSKQIFAIMDKFGFSWLDAYITFCSGAETIFNLYEDALRKESFTKDNFLSNELKTFEDKLFNESRKGTEILGLIDLLTEKKRYGLSDAVEKKISTNLRNRFRVLKNNQFRCIYCGRKAPEVELQLEHIIPKSKGGTDNITNLAPACFECNLGKSNIPLDEEK